MTDTGHTWTGRPVVFKDFTVKDLRDVRAAFAVSPDAGMWLVLSLSAFYGDGEGERIFADPDAIESQPARRTMQLTRMAGAAMASNGLDSEADGPLG